MTIETDEQLQGLLQAGRLVGQTLRAMSKLVRAGVSTGELDLEAERILQRAGALSAPREQYGFPGTLCVSLNDEAAHGIPGGRQLRAGDLVKLDLTVQLDGFVADAAVTVVVPPALPAARNLSVCARSALSTAISQATAGRRLREMGAAVERDVRRGGFSVVRELCGHGVGISIHEEPRCVPSYYDPRAEERLAPGWVVALEPHVTSGNGRITTADDGWTLRTTDAKPVANFEHTVIITRDRPIIATAA